MIQKEQAWQLRHEVMWPEKDLDYVKLEDDDEGTHFGLFDGEQLIAVVSLFVNGEEAQFRKFATLASHQNKGYGSRLLTYMLGEAECAGVNRIYCNARSGKVPFYERFGFTVTEQTFTKSGKDYIVMERFFGTS
ncbi:Predicted N-acyltransferase, GNAT family [Paenibacillus sophorae]|uniref:Predicted N-acyltransferase, GNAT family n=3 Tax=Paenibacillus sophorae TaxID=1333845 RepID=A0A1H8SVV9_9BACL|nr:GNAT family N-acetyltransferase [Paenibacillus sophorae]SEO82890.1 Predicted N-acyltransferase, GNAT family [Paenibacillus sophorae]